MRFVAALAARSLSAASPHSSVRRAAYGAAPMRLIFDLREAFDYLLKRLRWGALVPIMAALVAMIALAGCGGSAAPVKKLAPALLATPNCPVGAAFMGCATGAARHPAHAAQFRTATDSVVAPTPGCIFPDVSQWQGHLDWQAAAAHICGAAAKSGEGDHGQDPDFAWNVSQFRALHIPWAAYFFVRECSDGPQFVAELNGVQFHGDRDALRPVLDMEVRSAFNCAVPMADAIHSAFGVWPIIYTAPGTWPGGNSGGLDVWEADYTLGARAPFNLAGPVIAWQRYSPPFTLFPVQGLGTIDESIDLAGFTGQLAFPAPPPKPNPFLIYPARGILLYGQRVSERRTVERWWARGCENPVERSVCKTTRLHLEWFAGRLYTLAHKDKDLGEFNLAADWSPNDWGKRYYRIERILNGA